MSAPSEWRSRMERVMFQQAEKLLQLHRTVEHMANMSDALAACDEAQPVGITIPMQLGEHK